LSSVRGDGSWFSAKMGVPLSPPTQGMTPANTSSTNHGNLAASATANGTGDRLLNSGTCWKHVQVRRAAGVDGSRYWRSLCVSPQIWAVVPGPWQGGVTGCVFRAAILVALADSSGGVGLCFGRRRPVFCFRGSEGRFSQAELAMPHHPSPPCRGLTGRSRRTVGRSWPPGRDGSY